MKRLSTIVTLSLLTLSIIGCKPSIENQTSKFQSNKQRAQHIMYEMPIFQKLIEKEVKQIELNWQKAMKLSGEEAKIEALVRVNKSFNTGSLGKVSDLNSKISSVESNLNYLNNISASELTGGDLRNIYAAEQTLNHIKTEVSNSASSQNASVLLQGLLIQIQTANKSITSTVRKTKEKQKAIAQQQRAEEKIKQSSSASQSGNNKTVEPVKTISRLTCKYCKTSHKADQTTCSNCGANLN